MKRKQNNVDQNIYERIRRMILAKATTEEILAEMERWTTSGKNINYEVLLKKMKSWVLKGEASIEFIEQISVSWLKMEIEKRNKMVEWRNNLIEKIGNDKAAIYLKEFLAVEFELEEDYKSQIILQHFRGNEPIKKMQLQKQLREKYLSLYIQKFENKKAAKEYFKNKITKKNFESYENSIDWTIFKAGGRCANKSDSLFFFWQK